MAGGVVLFGGSFNPIHHGHLIAARAVAEQLAAGRVILVPSAWPPHKRDDQLASAAHRLVMARLAVQGEAAFEVSDMEVLRSGPSYTVLTVEAFRGELSSEQPLYWMIGGDSLPELHSWYRVRELVELCRIVTAVRPGFDAGDLSGLQPLLSVEQVARLRADVLTTPQIDISATDVRRRVAEGRSIRYLVPEPVRSYIAQHGLYRSPP